MTSTERKMPRYYDIPAIDIYGNHMTVRVSCNGPSLVTIEILTANTTRLAEYSVPITNTGHLLTAISACDRSARIWPEQAGTVDSPPDGRGTLAEPGQHHHDNEEN